MFEVFKDVRWRQNQVSGRTLFNAGSCFQAVGNLLDGDLGWTLRKPACQSSACNLCAQSRSLKSSFPSAWVLPHRVGSGCRASGQRKRRLQGDVEDPMKQVHLCPKLVLRPRIHRKRFSKWFPGRKPGAFRQSIPLPLRATKPRRPRLPPWAWNEPDVRYLMSKKVDAHENFSQDG